MKPSDIKIERTLSLTASQWDALLLSCGFVLHSLDIISSKHPLRYSALNADVAACYSVLTDKLVPEVNALHSSTS